jgi:hypothetical protein
MRKSDQEDEIKKVVSDDYVYVDYDIEFEKLISKFITKPFGHIPSLNQDLHALYT